MLSINALNQMLSYFSTQYPCSHWVIPFDGWLNNNVKTNEEFNVYKTKRLFDKW